MRHTLKALACAAALAVSSYSLAAVDAPPATQSTPRKFVEVCFVLDTTGSMGGLIDGAKKKIWTIANGIVAADKKAQVRFALVPYRDRGDEYVTKIFDLTDDLDKVFADLQSFAANGGGDGPESVNQALDDAVNKVAWSAGDGGEGGATKIIFLVGDAPPHMDYQDDVKYPQTCESAVRKNLIINTVQCGQDSSTTPLWQDIARKSEGLYVALEQSGGMVMVETPVDKELAEVSAQLGALAVPYGSREQQRGVAAKSSLATAAPAAVAAERCAVFNAASATTRPDGAFVGGKVVQGRGDLIADVADNTVTLESVKEDELPEAMRKMSPDERKAYLKQQADTRGKLTARVNDLAKQRQAFIDAENKKLAESGKGDAFDAKVTEIVNGQVNRKK